jgi:hypothetical protein
MGGQQAISDEQLAADRFPLAARFLLFAARLLLAPC